MDRESSYAFSCYLADYIVWYINTENQWRAG